MFRLHIYNPEHDIALGKNSGNFTPPKAADAARRAYGHFPAFWAADGDWVLVDDVAHARRMLAAETRKCADVKFVSMKDLGALCVDEMPSEIVPWGWDKLLVDRLLRCNPLFSRLVPSQERLDDIRMMSSREFAATAVLPFLLSLDPRLVGEMRAIRSMEEVESLFQSTSMACGNGGFVLKSPWSCSGRGVRMVSGEMTDSLSGWCRNVLREQGLLMWEPLYDREYDFAMEFMSDETAGTRYLGMNMFNTNRGAYLGNSSGTEADKWACLARFAAPGLFDVVREGIVDITSRLFHGRYTGPFGVDMMIVRLDGTPHVHPCVELNLRRTMGHAVL